MSLSHALQPKDISVSRSIYPNAQGLPVILLYSSLGAMIPQWESRLTPGSSDSFFIYCSIQPAIDILDESKHMKGN